MHTGPEHAAAPPDPPADGLPEEWPDPCYAAAQDSSQPDHLGQPDSPAWLNDPAVEAWLEETADDPPGAAVLTPGAPFTLGGAADVMAPGPVLASLAGRVHGDGLARLDDDALTGVLQATSRLASWAAALRLAAVSRLAARREAGARASGDWRPFEHAGDEIAVTLTLTGRSAGRLLSLAMALDRLPLTRAALETGAIDERRAEIIADELAGLDDEHAAAVEAALLGKAPGMTSGQLRPALRRAVLATDPQAAKQRKEKALKDARVEVFTETAGTAALSGRDLPPAEVLAADKNLTALAQGLRKAGAEGTLDELRARAYLHLLTGQAPETLLAAVTTPDGTPAAPDGKAAAPDGPAGQGPGHPAVDSSHPAGGRPVGSPGAELSGDGTPASQAGRAADASGPAGRGPEPGPGPGFPGLRGTVHLTVPLATWLGWSAAPGEAAGFGPLDAEDSRTLTGWLAANPATQWCLTITGTAGHVIAHGCASTGPPGQPPADRARPAGPGRPPATGPPGAWDWLQAITFTSLQTRGCTHPRQSRAYQPPDSLRHLITIRNATCAAAGCRRAAGTCDLDHTVPHHRGGRTCECNIGPFCRHHHRTKQAPGWTLTHHDPGHFTWTTPARRTYHTAPTSYAG